MWHRADRSEPDGRGETDAYQSGRYADYLVGRGAGVPAWAWMNAVARGSEVLVASLALAEGSPRDAPERLRGWYLARKAIAEEAMSTIADEECTLAELQRGVLRGLELELAAVSIWAVPDPEELICLALEALHTYRNPSRR